jgi:hypothetical protein
VRQSYAVTFTPFAEPIPTSSYRCPSDLALLRLLEGLLPSPEQRLRTLEQVRDAHEIAVSNVEVPEFLLTKYGFGGERGSSARGRHAAVCVVCARPTSPSNRLTTLSGDVVHFECRAGSGEILESAARFLRDSPGRSFCHACLARIFRIGFDETRKVVGRLRVRADMDLGTGQCSACGKHRMILSASATEAS